jgi:transcriptional regulator with XRE-family HTH domain
MLPIEGNMAKSRSTKRKARTRFSTEYEILLNRLVRARRDAGVTQKEIAEKIGKDQSHVSKCEHKEREITIIDLWKWCEAIGLSVGDFMKEFERDIHRADD